MKVDTRYPPSPIKLREGAEQRDTSTSGTTDEGATNMSSGHLRPDIPDLPSAHQATGPTDAQKENKT